MKPKVFFMRVLTKEEEEAVKEHVYCKMAPSINLTRDIVAEETEYVDAISTRIPSKIFLDEEILRNAKNLKIINISTMTYNLETFINAGLDVDVATELGIYITNTSPPLGEEGTQPVGQGVADKTFALLLAVAARIVEIDKFVRERKWEKQNTYQLLYPCSKINGQTLGIIGLGRIGKEVAKRAKGFNMNVLYNDVIRKKELESELGLKYVDLNTLLKESDFVSVNAGPVHHLIGEKELGLMKKDAILINTARGKCVDTYALANALKHNKIKGAGLDVFETEPIDPDHPIIDLENVVLSPHSAAPIEGYVKSTMTGIQNILNVCNGKMPLFRPVNQDVVKIKPLKNK